jgi:hypothetical protein
MNRYQEEVVKFQTCIAYDGHEFGVKAIILPARKAPHVGADSPRFMEPGHVAQVIEYSLYDDYGKEVTGLYFFDHERKEIEARILAEWTLDQTALRMMDVSPTLAEVNARRGWGVGA